MKKLCISLLLLFVTVEAHALSAGSIHLANRYVETQTVTEKTRVEADSGTVIDFAWANRTIKTLKSQSVYTSVKFLADANFAVKKDASGAVSVLYDFSGNNNDASQNTGANQPIWTAAQQNGKNGLVFAGASSHFLSAAGTITKLANNTIITTAICDDVAVNVNIHGSCDDASTITTRWAELQIKGSLNGDIAAIVSDDSTKFLVSSSPTATISNLTSFIASQSYTAGDTFILLWKNGISQTLTSVGTAASNVGAAYKFSLGRRGQYNGKYFTGKFFNSMIFSTALTTAQRQALENLINGYFQIY